MTSAAEAMLRILREERVSTVFGNPGTTELPFTEALARDGGFEYVLGVQEGSVVAMADGYARATGRPAFVSLHAAGGLANGLVGLLNARRSRTPLVVTAGQQDRRHLIQDPMLCGDLPGLAGPAVKEVFDVHRAQDLPLLLRRAFAAAVRPPAGPVFLSVPMDLLAEDTPVELPRRSTLLPAGPAPVDAAARLLSAAKAPAIVAGDGVGREGAVAELVAVAELLGASVFHQPMHDGVDFPGSHPLYAGGLVPVHAAIRAALDGHDVVFIVGCHAFTPHHYTPGPALPSEARVVQLDSDPAEPGRNLGVDVGLCGSIRPTLAALAAALAESPGLADQAAERTVRAHAVHTARRAEHERSALNGYGDAPLDPAAAAHAIAANLPPDAVVVEEAITSGVQLRRFLRLDRPRSLVHTVGGGLGSGIGMAVGTRLGDPSRPVLAVLGDGCTLFGLQGLWSAARYRVPVTILVMNNGEYRTLKETLDSWTSRQTGDGAYVGLDLGSPRLDFAALAEFFGLRHARVEDTGQLADLVAKSAAADGPLLVDVPITSHSDSQRI